MRLVESEDKFLLVFFWKYSEPVLFQQEFCNALPARKLFFQMKDYFFLTYAQLGRGR